MCWWCVWFGVVACRSKIVPSSDQRVELNTFSLPSPFCTGCVLEFLFQNVAKQTVVGVWKSWTHLTIVKCCIVSAIWTLRTTTQRFEHVPFLLEQNRAQKRVFREKLALDTACWLFPSVCDWYFPAPIVRDNEALWSTWFGHFNYVLRKQTLN